MLRELTLLEARMGAIILPMYTLGFGARLPFNKYPHCVTANRKHSELFHIPPVSTSRHVVPRASYKTSRDEFPD